MSMVAFISKYFYYFMQHLLFGDKQAFYFAFKMTGTPYSLAPRFAYGLGSMLDTDRGRRFYASALGQRHPVSGRLIFIHRNLKIDYPETFLQSSRSFTHMSEQDFRSPWRMGDAMHSYHPTGDSVEIRPLDEPLVQFEQEVRQLVMEMSEVAIIPYNAQDCEGEKHYFCDHN